MSNRFAAPVPAPSTEPDPTDHRYGSPAQLESPPAVVPPATPYAPPPSGRFMAEPPAYSTWTWGDAAKAAVAAGVLIYTSKDAYWAFISYSEGHFGDVGDAFSALGSVAGALGAIYYGGPILRQMLAPATQGAGDFLNRRATEAQMVAQEALSR